MKLQSCGIATGTAGGVECRRAERGEVSKCGGGVARMYYPGMSSLGGAGGSAGLRQKGLSREAAEGQGRMLAVEAARARGGSEDGRVCEAAGGEFQAGLKRW